MDFLIALRQEVEITVRLTRKNTVRYRLSLLDHHCAAPGLLIIFAIRQSVTLASARMSKVKDATPVVSTHQEIVASLKLTKLGTEKSQPGSFP